jgi:hypothetical protein
MQRIENYCESIMYQNATPSATCMPAGTPSSSVCQVGTYKKGTGTYKPKTSSSVAKCTLGSTMTNGVCMKNGQVVGGPTPLYYCQ